MHAETIKRDMQFSHLQMHKYKRVVMQDRTGGIVNIETLLRKVIAI
jgi:hypothetical protein